MQSKDKIVLSKDKNRGLQRQKSCSLKAEIVQSKDKNRAVQRQKSCSPKTEIVQSKDKNRAVQRQKSCSPKTEIVQSKDKNRAVQRKKSCNVLGKTNQTDFPSGKEYVLMLSWLRQSRTDLFDFANLRVLYDALSLWLFCPYSRILKIFCDVIAQEIF